MLENTSVHLVHFFITSTLLTNLSSGGININFNYLIYVFCDFISDTATSEFATLWKRKAILVA